MRRTEAWWVCGTCGKPVTKVGKPHLKNHLEHQKVCPKAGYGIKQIEQRKRA